MCGLGSSRGPAAQRIAGYESLALRGEHDLHKAKHDGKREHGEFDASWLWNLLASGVHLRVE